MTNPIIAYYLFEHLSNSAPTRMDCTALAGSHPIIEAARSRGKLWCYLCKVHTNISSRRRHPSMTISVYGTKANGLRGCRNLTSIYISDSPNLGSGDIPTLQGGDAVIMELRGVDPTTAKMQEGATLQMYIINGHASQRAKLHKMAAEGRLTAYMLAIREQATHV